jgi:DNA-binding CsgD family transcriptional regulator
MPDLDEHQDLLLEREHELREMDAALNAARDGRGHLLVIEGSPGVGKSRLLDALRDRGRAGGFACFAARAGELEREFPFGVVRQLFEPRLASASEDERAALLAGAARLAGPLFGLGDGGEGRHLTMAPGEAPFSTLHGLYWLCANLAAEEPVLLLVDDAHWADGPSLRWMSFFLARFEELGVLLGLTTRPAAPGAENEVLGMIASSRAASTVRPAPLTEPAVAELVRHQLSRDPSAEFSRACHGMTAGNPFFLRELLRELRFERVPPTADGVNLLREIGPRGISRTILRRLARLPQEANALGRAVAILGTRGELRHASALGGLHLEAAANAAGLLADAEILRAGSPLRFVHPIVRKAIYNDVPLADRWRAHAKAARLLEADQAPDDQVAAHLLHTHPTSNPWVVDTLRRAAKRAVSQGTPTPAIRYLRRALAEPPDQRSSAELLADLGSAENRASDLAAIDHLTQALELAVEPRRQAEIGLELGRALTMAGRLGDAIDALRRLIPVVAPIDRELGLRLEAELINVARLDIKLRPLVSETLAAFRDQITGEGPAERVLIANLAYDLAIRGEPATRVAELARRALGDGDLLAEETSESLTYYLAAWTLALAEHLDEATGELDAALADARNNGSALGFAVASCVRSNVFYRRGLILEAEADAEHALEAASAGAWQGGLPLAVGFLIDALIERGRIDAANKVLEESGIGEELPDSILFNPLLDSRGRLRVSQGQTERGLQDLLEAGRRGTAWGARTVAFISWRSSAALALNALDRTEEAQGLIDAELELARGFGAARPLGIALRAKGLIVGGEPGLALLQEAVATLDRSPARLERARSLVDLGAALRRRNQRSAAREPLRAGLDLADDCGAAALAERARTELAATGIRPRRPPCSGLDALTPSERRVAQMAAGGLGNREIAQALFVTTKTIEFHLGQVYRKLNVHSRHELPAVLA